MKEDLIEQIKREIEYLLSSDEFDENTKCCLLAEMITELERNYESIN